jgi:hypothetical protein
MISSFVLENGIEDRRGPMGATPVYSNLARLGKWRTRRS